MIRQFRRIKIGRAFALLVFVALVSATVRMVWANGVFSSVTPGFAGVCKTVAKVPGVSDIEVAGGVAFIAAGSARGPGAADGIYALVNGKLTRLAGAPKDFHPRGIGLYPGPDGKGLFLAAVNRRANGRFSIDSFEVTDPSAAPALVAQGTIEGGLLVNPQDVVMAGPNIFYVANGTAGKNPLIHLPQTYGLIPGGNILYFNGTVFKVAADGLYGTRSLVLARDGLHLIVGSLLSRNLRSYSREPFAGTLTEGDSLQLPAGPEKLSLDSQGSLWVAGHANLMAWRAAAADPGKRVSSQVLRVSLLDGVPQTAGQIYAGDEISGASVAAPMGKDLLIGSSTDGRLLDCTAN